MTVISEMVTSANGQEKVIHIEVEAKKLPAIPGGARLDPYAETRGRPNLAQESFTKAMDLIQTCAQQVSTTVASLAQQTRPQEFEVQFAIKIDAEIGAMIAKTSTEAQLQVTLRWSSLEDIKGEKHHG